MNKNVVQNDIIQISNIADDAVTGDKIADSTIKTQNVDFPTLKDYSTSEVDTGIKTHDGKSIYRQTFTFDYTSYSQEKTFNLPSGAKFVGIDSGYSFGENSNAGVRFPIPRVHDSSTLSVRAQAHNNTVTVSCSTGVSFTSGIITVLYTKN